MYSFGQNPVLAEPIKYIAYLSKQGHAMTDASLKEILNISRKNNQRDRVTGMLVHIAGSFVQFIEGEKIVIDRLYQRILQDRRHHDVLLIEEGFSDNRHFQGWSMAFKKLDGQSLNTLTGFRPFDPDLLFDYPSGGGDKLPALILLQNFIRDLQD